MERIWINLGLAADGLYQNKIRAFLTSLGVVFGVASVVAMLSIGRGAKEEVLQRMRLLGANNLMIKSFNPSEKENLKEDQSLDPSQKKLQKYSPGLTLEDSKLISQNIPSIEFCVPEISTQTLAMYGKNKMPIKLVGVSDDYFKVVQLHTSSGSLFDKVHIEKNSAVCVIGSNIKLKLFIGVDPIGKKIKCGTEWFTIIGVLSSKKVSTQQSTQLGIRQYDEDIYIPVSTYILKIQNRNLLTQHVLQKSIASEKRDEEDSQKETSTPELKNYNQLDQITVRIKNTKEANNLADILARTLLRRHNFVKDFEIIIPEQLLKQEKETREIWNLVLAALASISLVVGGVGIMNIMLASVVERTKEIGVRLSIGATKSDITQQFVAEAVMMSVTGGLFGIALGLGVSYAIEIFFKLKTIPSWDAVLLSFGVSAAVGLFFGILPAKRAAQKDPVESLRHE